MDFLDFFDLFLYACCRSDPCVDECGSDSCVDDCGPDSCVDDCGPDSCEDNNSREIIKRKGPGVSGESAGNGLLGRVNRSVTDMSNGSVG